MGAQGRLYAAFAVGAIVITAAWVLFVVAASRIRRHDPSKWAQRLSRLVTVCWVLNGSGFALGLGGIILALWSSEVAPDAMVYSIVTGVALLGVVLACLSARAWLRYLSGAMRNKWEE